MRNKNNNKIIVSINNNKCLLFNYFTRTQKIKSNYSKKIIKNDVMMISEETESELGEISIVIRITPYLSTFIK